MLCRTGRGHPRPSLALQDPLSSKLAAQQTSNPACSAIFLLLHRERFLQVHCDEAVEKNNAHSKVVNPVAAATSSSKELPQSCRSLPSLPTILRRLKPPKQLHCIHFQTRLSWLSRTGFHGDAMGRFRLCLRFCPCQIRISPMRDTGHEGHELLLLGVLLLCNLLRM